MSKSQIKSKQRVANHGEVFTAEREVNAMLDLVKPETERIDSRFLEPACGEGAFLTEILRLKLISLTPKLTNFGDAITYNEIFGILDKLNLKIYTPSDLKASVKRSKERAELKRKDSRPAGEDAEGKASQPTGGDEYGIEETKEISGGNLK